MGLLKGSWPESRFGFGAGYPTPHAQLITIQLIGGTMMGRAYLPPYHAHQSLNKSHPKQFLFRYCLRRDPAEKISLGKVSCVPSNKNGASLPRKYFILFVNVFFCTSSSTAARIHHSNCLSSAYEVSQTAVILFADFILSDG